MTHRPVSAFTAVLACVLTCVPVHGTAHAAGAPSAPGVLGPAELRRGQVAVVHTVFEGARIDTFGAVIVGILSGGRTEGTTILARAVNDRVVRTGIAQGMSGSPVYVDGRLIGALSSGWSFSREPVFGITPIGEMLALFDRAPADTSSESVGPSGVAGAADGASRYGEWRWDGPEPVPGDGDAADLRAGRGAATSLARLPLPLACAGLNAGAARFAAEALAPFGLAVVPGGQSAAADAGGELLPGSAVAVDVLRGDLQLSAIGTVTWRDGDRVLIFGHPFFQAGDVRMPLSTAEIVTILASDQMSFKLGVRGREVGAVLQDRRPAVGGRIGARARMLPFRVEVADGGSSRTFRFESIEDRSLAPILLGLAAVNSVLEAGGTAGNQTLRWTLTLARPGAPPLVLSDIVAGDSPVQEMGAAVSAPLRFLVGNPFQRLRLDSVTVRIEVEPGRRLWSLRTAKLHDALVRPGGRVRVTCELEQWRGGTEVREIELTVPEEVPEGRYTMWIGGGAELSRYEAGRLPGRFRVVSVDDAWRRLARARPSNAVYAALFARAPEVNADGRDYPELPVSALSVMASDLAAMDRTRRGDVALLDERSNPVDGVLRGELLVNVTVDPKAP